MIEDRHLETGADDTPAWATNTPADEIDALLEYTRGAWLSTEVKPAPTHRVQRARQAWQYRIAEWPSRLSDAAHRIVPPRAA